MTAHLFTQICTYRMKMLNKILLEEEKSLNSPYLLDIIDHFKTAHQTESLIE